SLPSIGGIRPSDVHAGCDARRPGPLGDLRPAVPRRDDQLRRSSGDRHPEGDAAVAVRLERGRLRGHRARLSARLRDRVHLRRPADGPGRHQDRLLARADDLVARRGRARRRNHVRPGVRDPARLRRPAFHAVGRRIHRRAVRPRDRRVGQLSGGDQDRRRMVPAIGTRVRHRPVQRPHQHRPDHHADGGADHHRAIRMAVGVHCDRGRRLRMARAVVALLRSSRAASAPRRRRARLHLDRSAGSGRARGVADAAAAPAGMGRWPGEGLPRSALGGLPDFFGRKFGLSLLDLGPPIIVIYLVSDAGSVFGGWLSSSLLKRGWTANAARKTAMLACATAVVPIVFASQVESMWAAVALISIAAAAHQGWSANVYTLASDMFPRQAVGSVIGFAGMSGAVGGMLIAKVTGYLLETTGSYVPVFFIAGTTYLVTLGVVHALAPRLQPANIAEAVRA